MGERKGLRADEMQKEETMMILVREECAICQATKDAAIHTNEDYSHRGMFFIPQHDFVGVTWLKEDYGLHPTDKR